MTLKLKLADALKHECDTILNISGDICLILVREFKRHRFTKSPLLTFWSIKTESSRGKNTIYCLLTSSCILTYIDTCVWLAFYCCFWGGGGRQIPVQSPPHHNLDFQLSKCAWTLLVSEWWRLCLNMNIFLLSKLRLCSDFKYSNMICSDDCLLCYICKWLDRICVSGHYKGASGALGALLGALCPSL